MKIGFTFRIVFWRFFLFLLSLVMLSPEIKGQTFFMGYGYGGHLYDLGAFNQVIDRYNAAHLLDAQMDPFSYLDGFSFQVGMGKKWLFSYGFSSAGKKRKALYSSGEKQYERVVRLKVKSYKLGWGYLFKVGEKAGLYLGVEGGADRLKVQGRAHAVGERKLKWDVVEKDWNFSAGPSVMIFLGKPLGLTINPFYNYSFTTASAESLDRGINGSAHLPPLEDYTVVLHHYGLRLFLGFQGF